MIPLFMGSQRKWRAYMALIAVYFFWGTTYLAIRMALEACPPILLIGCPISPLGRNHPCHCSTFRR